jgi:hypothetical protein
MSNLDLLRSLLDFRIELLSWVLCSIIAYGLITNAVHYVRVKRGSGRLTLLTRVADSRYSTWLVEACRLAFFLGIPYLALITGVTSPLLMGLWGPDWFQPQWFGEITLGAVLSLGALMLLLWGWRHALAASDPFEHDWQRHAYSFQRRLLMAPWGWGPIVLEVLYLEIHWAFYRSAAIRLSGAYYGAFAGFLLILLELLLNPAVREDLAISQRNGETLTLLATAFVVTVIYALTSNLWLCMVAHLGMQFGLLGFLEVSQPLAEDERQQD